MNYSYRQLGPLSVPAFKDILKMFGEAFGEPDAYQGAVPRDTYLASLLGKEHFIALAAFDGGNVVGGLVAYVLEKFEQERKEIYIYDLAVVEAHRRRGIATELIRQLRNIGKSLGAYVIFVQADQGDTPALRLYESLGTREDVHHFDIAIT